MAQLEAADFLAAVQKIARAVKEALQHDAAGLSKGVVQLQADMDLLLQKLLPRKSTAGADVRAHPPLSPRRVGGLGQEAAGVRGLEGMPEDLQPSLDRDFAAGLQAGEGDAPRLAANRATLEALGLQASQGVRDEHVRDLVERRADIRNLGIDACAAVSDDAVRAVGGSCGALEQIFLDGTAITDVALVALAQGCPHLIRLSVRGCASVTDVGVIHIASNCRELFSIQLDGTSVTDRALEALGQGCPDLHLISLEDCTGLTDAGVLHLLQGCLHLANIRMDHTSVTDRTLEALGQKFPHLVTITLGRCTSVTEAGVLHLVQGCPNIAIMVLDGTGVGDTALEALGRGCRYLRLLSLRGCASVTDDGMVQLARGCPRLQILHLDGTSVGDSTLEAVGKGCPELQKVSLEDCAGVTDAGVRYLAQGCSGLHDINLDGTGVADDGVMGLAQHCHNVRNLALGNCTGVTDRSVSRLVERCRKLEALKLNGCPRVTDIAVNLLAMQCKHLAQLGLEGCSLVTDASIAVLFEQCQALREINLDGTGVLSSAVLVLAQQNPNVDVHHRGFEQAATSAARVGRGAPAKGQASSWEARRETQADEESWRAAEAEAEAWMQAELATMTDDQVEAKLLWCMMQKEEDIGGLLTFKASAFYKDSLIAEAIRRATRRGFDVHGGALKHEAQVQSWVRHLEAVAQTYKKTRAANEAYFITLRSLPADQAEARLRVNLRMAEALLGGTIQGIVDLMILGRELEALKARVRAEAAAAGETIHEEASKEPWLPSASAAASKASLVHATDALGMRSAMLLLQSWWRSILTKQATAFKGPRRPQMATHVPPSAPLHASFLESEELRGCPSCSRASILAVLPGCCVLLLGRPSPCRFDAAARLWRPLPAHPDSSLSVGCVVPGSGGEPDKVVCFGHEGQAFVLDTSTWSWEEEQAIACHPPARRLPAAVTVGTAVWLIGGDTMSQGDVLGPPVNDVWSFDMSRPPPERWLELSPSGNRFPPRSAHSATFVDSLGRVCLFGGSDGDQVLDDLWVVDIIAGPSGLRCYPVRPAGTRPPPMAGHIAVPLQTPSPTVLFWGGQRQELHQGVFALDADTFSWALVEVTGWPSGARLVAAAPFGPAEVLVLGGVGDAAGGVFGTVRVDPEDFEVRLANPCAAAMIQSEDDLVVLYVPAGATDEAISQEVRVKRLSEEEARCSGLRGDRRSYVYELLPDHVHFRHPVMLGMFLAAGPEGQSGSSRWRCGSVGGARILHAASLGGDWEVLACASQVDAYGCWIWAEMAHFCFVCVECCYPLHSINARSSESQVLVEIDLHTANKQPMERGFWHVFERGPWGDPFKNGQTFTLGVRGGKARPQVTRWVHEPMTNREPRAGVCDHMDRPTSKLEVLRDGQFMAEYDLGLFNLPDVGAQRAIPVGALIVGNSAYCAPLHSLPQAIKDADRVQESLSVFNFRHTLSYHDASERDLLEAFTGLVDCMREEHQACPDGSCLLCFFYYAGHAIQQNGDICLLPAGVPAEASPERSGECAEASPQDAVPLSRLILPLNGLGNRMRSKVRLVCVYVHDACLDDPNGDANGTYFNKQPTSKGTSPQPALPELWNYRRRTFQSRAEHLHLLACDPGRVAAERKGGRGSWVAEALVEHLRWNADLQRVFEDVRTYVVDESVGAQRPWICACMSSRGVYFEAEARAAAEGEAPEDTAREGVAGQSALSCGHCRESLEEECSCCRAYCQTMDAKAEAASTVAQSSASSSGPEEGQASAQSGLPSAEPASWSAPQPAQQAQHPRTWLLGLLPLAVAVPCALLQGGATFELLRPAFRAPAQLWIRWLSRGPERA